MAEVYGAAGDGGRRSANAIEVMDRKRETLAVAEHILKRVPHH